jgi:hypothetical protein
VPKRTYTSWAPTIDITEHLLANSAVVPHDAVVVPSAPATAEL